MPLSGVIFDGFETEEQAKAFAQWYEGQGEQESGVWLEEHTDLSYANVDMDKCGDFEPNEKNEIIVPLKLYKK